ncbi:hypothetical protein [Agarilytica rhodophyticola]|uniref:hypothetical protein n=1 Tax=Agarilytica rhodophyticola TaxID=1737490 RepID=UPI000B341FA8|nr:hypothetical protein [Agarilytica rhodophyticola]
MKISVESTNVDLNREEKDRIEQQAQLLFSRIRNVIDTIKISLSDDNGPKGGIDKQCVVVVNGKLDAPIVIKDTQLSAQMATKNALQRANHAFLRKWKRKQLLSKKVPLKTANEQPQTATSEMEQ